jgi:serine/threonine protein kinase
MVRIIENYTLYEAVGEGAFGKVYRAVNKSDNR